MKRKYSEKELSLALAERRSRASKMLKDVDKTERFLIKLENKLKEIPAVGGLLADVPTLISLVRSYVKKEYTKISFPMVVLITAALLYVFSPLDLMPDLLPGLGYLDDAALVAYLVGQLHQELDTYRAWREAYGVVCIESVKPKKA